jgi:hypothetical protein
MAARVVNMVKLVLNPFSTPSVFGGCCAEAETSALMTIRRNVDRRAIRKTTLINSGIACPSV